MAGIAGHSERRGGRAARRLLRSKPQPRADRPAKAGVEGGCYKPLGTNDIHRIHNAALTVLEDIGLCDALQSCIDLVTKAGGWVDSQGRLRFPRSLVEDVIAQAARGFILHGRDPQHDMELKGRKVHFATAGAAVHIVDPFTREYHESTLNDLYNIARLVDACEHIHMFQRPIVARDATDPRDLDINTLYGCISGTSKPVGTSFTTGENAEDCLKLLHLVAGSEEAWRARPFVSMSCCFVVPPLKFAEDACRALEVAVRGGMPVLLLAAGQAGATSPAALAGAVVQEVAEVLAGLVYVNAIVPGAPAIFGTWPFVSDLRTGAMSGGSPEQVLLMSACAQMAQFYDLPGGVASGMADSKLPDAQSGAEKAYNHALIANAGANIIYEAAGMQASLLGFCLESVVMDNDIIGASLRTVRGIEVNDDTLSIEVIKNVCTEGPGHFLGHDQTLARMQSDYLYPEIGDRRSPKEWIEAGSKDSLDRAHAKVKEILSSHYPALISPDVDQSIREAFPILLPQANMRAN